MNQDFALLYSELGLRPGCSLVELKRAYRRRVAELHPDRAGMQPPVMEQNLALPDLIALYTAAIHFHRQYGRLPGGQHVRGTAAASPMRSGTRRAMPPAPTPAHDDEPKLPFGRTLFVAILLVALLVVLQAFWDRLDSGGGGDAHTPVGFIPDSAPAVVDAAGANATGSPGTADPSAQTKQSSDTTGAP